MCIGHIHTDNRNCYVVASSLSDFDEFGSKNEVPPKVPKRLKKASPVVLDSLTGTWKSILKSLLLVVEGVQSILRMCTAHIHMTKSRIMER